MAQDLMILDRVENAQPVFPMPARELVQYKRNQLPATKDQLTLEAIVSWLEQQEPSASYDWDNCAGDCLLGRFVQASSQSDWAKAYKQLVLQIPNVQKIAIDPPWTFGAALERARRLQEIA